MSLVSSFIYHKPNHGKQHALFCRFSSSDILTAITVYPIDNLWATCRKWPSSFLQLMLLSNMQNYSFVDFGQAWMSGKVHMPVTRLGHDRDQAGPRPCPVPYAACGKRANAIVWTRCGLLRTIPLRPYCGRSRPPNTVYDPGCPTGADKETGRLIITPHTPPHLQNNTVSGA